MMATVHVQHTDNSESESIEENDKTNEEDASKDQCTKSGLADVMAKILHKSVPQKKPVILSRGKTDKEIQRKKRSKGNEEGQLKSSDISESEDDSPEARRKAALRKKMKKEWDEMGRAKPNILEKDKERNLTKIATRGVVHVFNAVNERQKQLEEQLETAGTSERRREKVLSSMDKKSFLDLLDKTKPNSLLRPRSKRAKQQVPPKNQRLVEDSETWNILRDDYMIGANMKDWDKDSDDELGKAMATGHRSDRG